MLTAAKMALAIVGPGLLLGTLGGSLVKPVPKDPLAEPWQLSGQPEIAIEKARMWFEAPPEDISHPDGFRPDLDYDAEITAYWIDRFEGFSSAGYDYEPLAPLSEIAEGDVTGAPLAIAEPGAEVAATAAQDVADAAIEAQSMAEPEAPREKPALAEAGLW